MNNHLEDAARRARRNRRIRQLKVYRQEAVKRLEAIDSEIFSLEQEARREL